MEILIERDIRESSPAINKMQWQLFLKLYYLWIALYLTIGVILIIVYFKGDSFGLALGMALVIFAFLYILNLVRASEKSHDRLKMEIAKRSKTDPINRIKLTDSKFVQESGDAKVEFGWNVFQSFKVYNDSIFLISSTYLDSYVLRKSDMSDAEFSEVLAFISRTIAKKDK